MLTGSSIEELAGQMSLSAQRLSTFLRCNGYQYPSFDRSCPSDTLSAEVPEDIVVAQQDLAENALKLFRLAIGPREFLADMAVKVSQENESYCVISPATWTSWLGYRVL